MSEVQLNISELPGAQEGQSGYLVSIAGQLDETNVDEKSQEIYALVEKHPANLFLVIDLSQLTYMNSKSIGYLTDWYTKVSEGGGKLVLAAAQDNVLDVLSVVGITNLVQHYGTVDEAKSTLFAA